MNHDWSESAACKGEPYEVFFGAFGEAFDPAPALAICDRCPVLDECREYAEHHGDIVDGKAVSGVIAGVAPRTKANGRPVPPERLPRVCALPTCNVRFTQPKGRPGGARFYCSDAHSMEGRRLGKERLNKRRTA